MIYDFLYYTIPKFDIGVDEIPLIVYWEIDNVPAGYPSAHDPFEEATEPRPLVFEIRLHETERDKYKSAIWQNMLDYVEKHEDELMKEVQESTALQEAFDDVVDPNPY